MLAVIGYQVGVYRGTITVSCDEDEDDEVVLALAREGLKKQALPWSPSYERFWIIEIS